MSFSFKTPALPEAPKPIPPPPAAAEDTVRRVGKAKKPNQAKNPLLIGDAPQPPNGVAGASPSGIFGGSGGLALY